MYAHCMFKERLQILLSTEQRRRLEGEARRRDASVASLVREAIDARFGGVTADERLRAVTGIALMTGRFLPPDELDRVGEEERANALDQLLRDAAR